MSKYLYLKYYYVVALTYKNIDLPPSFKAIGNMKKISQTLETGIGFKTWSVHYFAVLYCNQVILSLSGSPRH